MKVLAIIPAYNEAGAISLTIDDLKKNCPKTDILVVDDGSSDLTSEIAKRSGAIVIILPINLGIGGAVQTGLKYAQINNYDFAFQFDGDGQHRADQLDKILSLAKDNTDLVIGSRFVLPTQKGFKSTIMRRLGIRFFSYLLTIFTSFKITDSTSGFRMFGKQAIDFFSKHYPYDFPEPEVIAMAYKKGFSVKEVPVVMNERLSGKSSIDAIKSVNYVIKVTFAIFFSLWRKLK